jgi:hypothetical protein
MDAEIYLVKKKSYVANDTGKAEKRRHKMSRALLDARGV